VGIKMSQAFPSKYLKAADLHGKTPTVIIERVEMGKMEGDDGESKPIVYFKKAVKGLVLNKTNATKLTAAYGDDTDNWIGQPVTLFMAYVEFKGETVEAIRLRIPSVPKRANSPQAPLPPLASPLDELDGIDDEELRRRTEGLDDEIGF
jgi:hypothetical protein